jgi:hypothetical protein
VRAQGQRVWEEVAALTGECCCLTPAALCWGGRLQRLFFLNEGQASACTPPHALFHTSSSFPSLDVLP